MKSIQMLDLKLEYDHMKKDIDEAIRTCLNHQRWILGPEVRGLEERIADYLGVKHCIGICSGTESLVLSLRALAIKLKGQEFFDKTDEIITTSFTFTATGDAILRAGATPVFIDIDPESYNIDIAHLGEYLNQNSELRTQNSKVVGIVPVHLYGQSCDMDNIMKIAEEHDLFVVEDVAQAFGGAWKDKKLGTIGTTGSFSFFPSKNLGGFGDGGMISTDDDRTMELVRMLLRHGGKDKYNVEHIGYNARLDTLQAAIVLAKFKYIDEFNVGRRKIAETYNEGLKGTEGIVLPASLPDAFHVSHQYTIRVLHGKRDDMQSSLKDKGISTMIYYPYPLHKMKVFGNGRSKSFGSLEQSETATESVLSLPIEPLQQQDATLYVIDCIKEYCNNL
ncbi:MAG: DegT/DnrJ/EryC1/StrS family aminotransferase [Nitrospiraceae bacterium]|nr:MAG: DegT/DnrJ/EryC1/StrS family aminotransferase [Nitrospiraceae bacterium]